MKVLGVILGGGAGSRLRPLTVHRSKPAVPLAGKYRLVDVPLSSCINSRIFKIFVLTQYNSASLHQHIQASYQFDQFTDGFVQLLAAEQTPESKEWFQGTADAVRQSMHHLASLAPDYVVILSGDQLFRIDLQPVLARHIARKADLTICNSPVPREEAGALGILQSGADGRVQRYLEKPAPDSLTAELCWSREDQFLASMGLYVFNFTALQELLQQGNGADFGHHLIPQAMATHRVFGDTFKGYWQDIGTIRSFWKANLALTADVPPFCFYDKAKPIFTRARFLPPSRIQNSVVKNCLLSEGVTVTSVNIVRSVIGLRSIIGEGTEIVDSVVMGNDFYEDNSTQTVEPPLGIGKNCRIEKAIIDKDVRIGNNVFISPRGQADIETERYWVRDGVVVIPKGAVLPDNWRIGGE